MPDSLSFRQMMGCFATGVTVVTAEDSHGKAFGITINSLTSVSLEPPLILFCLDRRAHIFPIFQKLEHFAVNILTEAQEDISQHFADYRHHPKPTKLWDKSQNHCPILRQTLGWMICNKTKVYKSGDHDIILGEVVKLKLRNKEQNPLLYFRSRYRKIKGVNHSQ